MEVSEERDKETAAFIDEQRGTSKGMETDNKE